MNISMLGDWVDVIYKLCGAVFCIWLYLDRRNDKTHIRIGKLEDDVDKRLDGHSDRLTRMETTLTKQPTHEHLAEVYRDMRNVTTSVTDIAIALAGIEATLLKVDEQTKRMNDFWLNKNN
jgi:hypothetical protein